MLEKECKKLVCAYSTPSCTGEEPHMCPENKFEGLLVFHREG